MDPQLIFRDLSLKAKTVYGVFIGMKTQVVFQMQQAGPTPECQEALDELVTAGLLKREVDTRGVVTYTNLDRSLSLEAFLWANEQAEKGELLNFKLLEPIKH